MPRASERLFRRTEIYGQRWACRGYWSGDSTFTLEQDATDKVFRRRATLGFAGDILTLTINDRITGTVEVLAGMLDGR